MAQSELIVKEVPVADMLAAKLRREIDAKRFRPGDFVITERALARREGIDRNIVHKAVNALVREGRLERRPGKGVYVPGAVDGWRQAASTSRLVHVLVADLAANMCVEIARGIKQAGLSAGVRIQVHDAHGSLESDLQVLRKLPETAVHGAIIDSVHHPRFAEVLYELHAARYPFVLVDETLRDLQVPSVVADNYRGGYLAGRALMDRRHRRIAFTGFLGADTVRARLEGLRDAMAEAGVALDRSLVVPVRLEPVEILELPADQATEIERAVREILERPDRPTAIFFSTDLFMPQAYRAIRGLGLRIPDDVSVVGFDGDPLCRLLSPTLATVRQPAREMGKVAMEMLLALMDGRRDEGVVNRAARTPVAVRDGSKANGRGDAGTHGHGDAATRRDGETVAGRRVASMETEVPLAAANTTQRQDSAWHRVLPVTWQDGDSLGPAPDAVRDCTAKDTKATDGSREAAKGAKEIRMTDREMVGV